MRERAVVEAHRAALLEVGYLLTGDERAGEDRVDRALARLSPQDDHAAAVRALLATRSPRGGLVEAGPDPWWVPPAELAAAHRTAAALAGLDDDDRAALVLDHEGLPADPVRLARARAVLADPGPALAGLLAVRRPPHRDDEEAAAVVRAHRRARRVRPLLAGGAVVVLGVLAVVVPRGAPPAVPTAGSGTFAGPTRGSLAGDEQFLADARAQPWGDGSAPDSDDRQVVYAGDLLDRRWVLVVGRTTTQLLGQWFTAPVGAPAGALDPAGDAVSLRSDRPAALLLDTDLVVVAAPGEGVRVSTGQDVAASGAVGRTYAALPVEDGVGALALAAPDPGGIALRVQVVRTGEYSNLTLADVPVTRSGVVDAAATAPPLAPLRGADPDLGSRAQAADQALAEVAVPTGLDPAALAPVLLWAGVLPDARGGSVDAVVLAVPQPSGAVVVSAAWSARLDSGVAQTVGCGSQAFPVGTDPATLTAAVRCVVADRDTGAARTTVVLTAPTGTDLVPDDARTTVVLDAADGSVVDVVAAGPADLFDE